jgi:hypothetical protein
MSRDMSIQIKFCTVIVKQADFQCKLENQSTAAPLVGLSEAGLVRWVCRSPAEAISAVKRLERLGFKDPAYTSEDIAVVDAQLGLLAPCTWLDVSGNPAEGWTVGMREASSGH